jgi:hypothetical protein
MLFPFEFPSLRRASMWLLLSSILGGPVAHAADTTPAAEEDPLNRTGKTIKLRKMEEVDLSSEYQIIA